MTNLPVIFLTFANDQHGQFLEALRPEKIEIKDALADWQKAGKGLYHFPESTDPFSLTKNLNKFQGQITIFHFSGHADIEKVQLEAIDGSKITLHNQNLTAILEGEAKKELKLVFLNACLTQGIVESLQQIGVPAIIATDRKVPDALAKDFAVTFYDSLLKGDSLKTAFQKSKSTLAPEDQQKRVYRGFILKENIKYKEPAHFPWGLHILDDKMLDWKLPKPTATPRFPTELNRLPGPPSDFIGREDDLQAVKNLLEDDKPIILLNGIGGIGKTTLARQYLYKNYEAYDHIAWISVLTEGSGEEKGFQSAQEAIAFDLKLMDSLGLPFNPELDSASRCKQILSQLSQLPGKNLLIIDNAGFSLEDIRKDLPQPPNWKVLVTSRKDLPGFKQKRIDELPPEQALELFCTHYPSVQAGSPNEQDIKELLAHIGYHTLTVELFARTCMISPSTSPKKILHLLQEKRLPELSRKVWSEHSDREVKVYGYLLTAFELSQTELNADEQSLLTQLAVLPSEDYSWEFLLQLFGVKEDVQEGFEDALMGLVKKGWISQNLIKNQGFKAHQLIQEVIRYHFPPDEENCKAILKGVARLLYTDQAKDNPINKFPLVIYGEAVLNQIEGNAIEVSELQNNLASVCQDLGRFEEAAVLLEKALQSNLTNFGEAHTSIPRRRSSLALVYQDLGRFEEAAPLLEEVLRSVLDNFGGAHPKVAISRSNLATVYQDLGRFEEAAPLLEAALQSAVTNFGEAHPSVARRRSNLATVYMDLGRFEEAADLLEGALQSDLTNFGEAHPAVAKRRSNLGLVYKGLGEFEKAAALLEGALQSDLTNFGEAHPDVAIRRSNLATVYLNLGKKDEAKALFQQAYDIFFQLFGETHPHTQNVKKWIDNT